MKRSYSGEGGRVRFHLCCRGGKVQLPLLKDPPPFLAKLLNPNGDILSRYFLKSIRSYNSMFVFTSLGAKIDMSINKGPDHMYLKLMARFIIELDLCYQKRVSPRFMHNFILLILKMRLKIEYQFLIEIGIVIVEMRLIV